MIDTRKILYKSMITRENIIICNSSRKPYHKHGHDFMRLANIIETYEWMGSSYFEIPPDSREVIYEDNILVFETYEDALLFKIKHPRLVKDILESHTFLVTRV